MRILVLLVCLLAGCRSASERCASISLQAARHAAYVTQEQRVTAGVEGHPDYPAKFADDTARIRMRREVLEQVTRRTDELMPHPPPRPSDLAWSQKHCFQGRAQ
jgi:hypothetical protein